MWNLRFYVCFLILLFCNATPFFPKSHANVTAKAGPLKVFIIPHTHDDVGWVETVDQYYITAVQFIIDSVVDALMDNPARKFTYVEIAFFSRWWNEQSDTKKAQVQQLVDNGQLQFNLGGWTMNDEAASHYDREINQMTEGNQWLLKNLNTRPTVGWHVDPFGHSSATASLWADVGFDAFGLNRIDYRLKEQMQADQGLEFIWRSSSSLGTTSDIWAHVLDSFYCTPGECAYDEEEGGKVVNADAQLPTYGVDVASQATDFINMARQRNAWYRHNYILIPYGCDFTHKNALRSFKEMDILMNYINSNPSLQTEVVYAHFADYVEAVNALNLTWDVYTDDFFPYASGDNSYWTGYFNSHNEFKGYVRQRTPILRLAEVLNTVAYAPTAMGFDTLVNSTADDDQSNVVYLRQSLSQATHHDAITGTAKDFVYVDYEQQINTGTTYAANTIATLAGKLLSTSSPPALTVNGSTIISQLTSGKAVAVVLHNSVGWVRRDFVSIPVNRTDLSVVDSSGATVPTQIDPVSTYSKTATSTNMLYFLVNLPPMGYNTYYIVVSSTPNIGKVTSGNLIANDFYSISTDSTGRINSIGNKISGAFSSLKNDMYQYRSAYGNDNGQSSGAYVFRPAQDGLLDIGSTGGSEASGGCIFVSPFPAGTNPLAIITADGENYTDTFGTSIQQLNSKELIANIYREDMTGWGQNAKVNFLTWAPGTQPRTGWTGFQSGTVNVGTSNTNCVTITITFTKSFASTPRLLVTPSINGAYTDILLAAVQTKSTSGATVNMCRAQSTGGWGNSALLYWLAWDSTATVTPDAKYGNSLVGSSSTALKNFTINTGGYSYGAAIVLAQINAASNVYAISTTIVELGYINVNIRRIDNQPWTDNTVNIDWLIVQRPSYGEFITDIAGTGNVANYILSGPYVQTLHQQFRANYSQATRLYKDGSGSVSQQHDLNFIDFTNDLGTIDRGYELVTYWDTDIPTNGMFTGDGNGLERRDRQYKSSQSEPIAGNFYPMVHSGSINGKSAGKDVFFTFVTDRAHAMTSLTNGNIQVMLARRCVNDDGYGVGEVLDESAPISINFRLILDNEQNTAYLRHRYQLFENYNPIALYASATSVSSWASSYVTSWTALTDELPQNLHLLTFELRNYGATGQPGKDQFILVRLQHLYEVGESTQYSTPLTVDVSTIFSSKVFTFESLQETALLANIASTDLTKLQWQTSSLDKEKKEDLDADDFVVTLNPRNIKTYRVNAAPL